jgi:hypothetical protein
MGQTLPFFARPNHHLPKPSRAPTVKNRDGRDMRT